jgi:hypothetical protein
MAALEKALGKRTSASHEHDPKEVQVFQPNRLAGYGVFSSRYNFLNGTTGGDYSASGGEADWRSICEILEGNPTNRPRPCTVTTSLTSGSSPGSDYTSHNISSASSESSELSNVDHQSFPQILLQHRRAIANRIFAGFYAYRERTNGPSGSQSSSSPPRSEDRQHSSPANVNVSWASTVTGTKRKKPDQDEASEDDGRESRKKVLKSSSNETEDYNRLLACPFNKLDPLKYKSCNRYTLRGMNRVK